MPAIFAWVGGYDNNNFDDPRNFQGGYTGGPLPAAGDDITFAAISSGSTVGGEPVSVSADDSNNFHGPTVGEYNSVRVLPGYERTITMSDSVKTSIFEMKSVPATIDQAGEDITVTGEFTWTGGTINVPGHTADVHLDGGVGLIDPGSGGTVQTASTLLLEDNAEVNFESGTLQFTDGDGVDVGEGCTATVAARAQAANLPVNFDKITYGPAKITIHPTGFWDVKGPWNSELPIYNDGGRFQVLATLNVSIDSGSSSTPAVYQTANPGGTTELNGGSTLTLKSGTNDGTMQMDGGSLWVRSFKWREPGDFGWVTYYPDVTIKGTLEVYGGFIQYDLRAIQGSDGALTRSSTLKVIGDVYWGGGTFNAGYEPTSTDCTKWTATGTMYIFGDATVQPVGSGLPTVARTYQIITAGTIVATGAPANTSTTMDLVLVGTTNINLVYTP